MTLTESTVFETVTINIHRVNGKHAAVIDDGGVNGELQDLIVGSRVLDRYVEELDEECKEDEKEAA